MDYRLEHADGERLADSRVHVPVVRLSLIVVQLQRAGQIVFVADHGRQPFGVRDVLYDGRHDFPGFVEDLVVGPMAVQVGQLLGYPVVFPGPHGVHGRQHGVRVGAVAAGSRARRVRGRARAADQPGQVVRRGFDQVNHQLAASGRRVPQRPHSFLVGSVQRRPVQKVRGLVQLSHNVLQYYVMFYTKAIQAHRRCRNYRTRKTAVHVHPPWPIAS